MVTTQLRKVSSTPVRVRLKERGVLKRQWQERLLANRLSYQSIIERQRKVQPFSETTIRQIYKATSFDEDTRFYAIKDLGNLKDSRLLPVFGRALNDPYSIGVRHNALYALAKLKHSKTLSLLFKMTKPGEIEREDMSGYLGEIYENIIKSEKNEQTKGIFDAANNYFGKIKNFSSKRIVFQAAILFNKIPKEDLNMLKITGPKVFGMGEDEAKRNLNNLLQYWKGLADDMTAEQLLARFKL